MQTFVPLPPQFGEGGDGGDGDPDTTVAEPSSTSPTDNGFPGTSVRITPCRWSETVPRCSARRRTSARMPLPVGPSGVVTRGWRSRKLCCRPPRCSLLHQRAPRAPQETRVGRAHVGRAVDAHRDGAAPSVSRVASVMLMVVSLVPMDDERKAPLSSVSSVAVVHGCREGRAGGAVAHAAGHDLDSGVVGVERGAAVVRGGGGAQRVPCSPASSRSQGRQSP